MKSIKKGLRGSEEKMTYKELKKRERKALKLKNRKGLSPVIATVILVAVTITVAVAVSYWMSSIAGQYTTFEKVEIPAHYSKYVDALDVTKVIGVGTGLAGDLTFSGDLECIPIVPGSVEITDGAETFLDDGNGVLESDKVGGTDGSIVYATGAYSVTFAVEPAGPTPGPAATITAEYSTPGWKEYIELRNSGSKDATITNMFLNNVPLYDYEGMRLFIGTDDGTGEEVPDLSELSVAVSKGSGEKIVLWIPENTEGCSPSTTIDLKIITAAGNQYPILEVLV